MVILKRHVIVLFALAAFTLLTGCFKDEPNYSDRMLTLTKAPWKWTSVREQYNNDPWVELTLAECILDNYHDFEPYENKDLGIMRFNYGAVLCSPDESEGWKTFDYWAFYENETMFRASSWGGPTNYEPGEILALNNSVLKLLFVTTDSNSTHRLELTFSH